MNKRQEAIELIAQRIRAAGEIGSFSFALTLVEGAHVLEGLRDDGPRYMPQTEIDAQRANSLRVHYDHIMRSADPTGLDTERGS